ncbi:unnamed protein product [Ambrosiozyma monospora]|uniref:Unnamed protein product n=1 Tax=Ambrosiozyma monospora TaxID=43982 RepID=A0A9W6SYF3_AMBMO|nr:unnamed protein product [Ambrosiozyma monospora]
MSDTSHHHDRDHCIHDQGGVDVFDESVIKLVQLAQEFKTVKNFSNFNRVARQNIIKCNEFLIKIAGQKNALTTRDVFKYDEALEKLIKDPMTPFSPRLFKQFESHQLTADWSQSELPLLSQHATSLAAKLPSGPPNPNAPRSPPRGGKRTKRRPAIGSANSSLPNPGPIVSLLDNAKAFNENSKAELLFRASPLKKDTASTADTEESENAPSQREHLLAELTQKAAEVAADLKLPQPSDEWELFDFSVSATTFPDYSGDHFYRVELSTHSDITNEDTLEKVRASFVNATLPSFQLRGKPEKAFTQLACYAVQFPWGKRNKSKEILSSIFDPLGTTVEKVVKKPTAMQIKASLPGQMFTTFVAVDLVSGMAPLKSYKFFFDHQVVDVKVRLNTPMQSCSFCHMIGHSIPECCVRSPCKRCHSEDHCYLSCEETGDDELVEIVDSFPDLYMICLPTTDGTYSWMQRYIQIKDNRSCFGPRT